MNDQQNHSESKPKLKIFGVLVVVLFLTLLFAYSNHFKNSFHFDDTHTIQTNTAIKDMDVVSYFTDTTTFSTLAANQVYRPLTVLQNAIDYKIGDGLNPKVFHIHIFITYVIVSILFFFFVKKLLDQFYNSDNNKYWALLPTALFSFLTANAETVNYIIQRAEISSALFILAGLIAYQANGIWRKWYLYLIFPIFGFLSKEMGLVFAPLLFIYCLLFEEKAYLLDFYKKEQLLKIKNTLIKTLPAFIISIVFYIFYTSMIPETFTPGGASQSKYLITQPMVICHYMLTYIFPYELSADTDWQTYNSILDYRAIIGIVILLSMFFLALRASKKEETRLFSFGFLWFFVSLLPTSSFIPLAEVMNDHRAFIPYLGFTLAIVFGIRYLVEKYLTKLIRKKSFKIATYTAIAMILAGNVYGIRERNKIWKNNLTLWEDVTLKSPKNARGHMNYGVALMKNARYDEAEKSFNKAADLNPNYSLIYINLGIAKNAQNNKVDAEKNFKKALAIEPNIYNTSYHYGNFLMNNNRYNEAKIHLEKTYQLAPNFENGLNALFNLYHKTQEWKAMENMAKEILANSQNNTLAKKYLDIALNKKSEFSILEDNLAKKPSAEGYLDLSLKYYNIENYDKTILAAKKALEINKNLAGAYNNIGIGYFKLKDYEKAYEAYNNAIRISPDYTLAQNNLKELLIYKEKNEALQEELRQLSTSEELLNFSLKCYNEEAYLLCIEAATKSNSIKKSTFAYNNICAAYNKLGKFNNAIEACNKALEIDRSNSYAKGNLDFAILQNSLK